MAKEHREAMDIARKVCLHCREQGVEADGACGQCGSPRALASEPRPSVALWPRPDWTVVPEAKTNQDLYECIALSGVARINPGPNRAVVKEISILRSRTHLGVQKMAGRHGRGAHPHRAKDSHFITG